MTEANYKAITKFLAAIYREHQFKCSEDFKDDCDICVAWRKVQ